ncbi:MAG: class I SAM-dependent methyltransferase [Aggregatilineales bacterium]
MVETVQVNSPRIDDKIERHQIAVCNLCGHRETAPYCPENGRGLVQCQHCELVYVGSQPDADELHALYSESYFHNDESGEVGYSDYIGDEINIRKTSRKRLKHLSQFITGGRMMDVGCAMGFFIDEASKQGFDVEGLDVSQFATEYVEKHFGHEVHTGSLLVQDFESSAYDMVTMYDVIEHVPDPKAYMEKVADMLKPGGIYELATPDVGSFPAKLAGSHWIGYKLADEHVYYFSVATLKKMLGDAGFDVLAVRHIGKFVTMKLFLDRLGFYVPWLSKPLEAISGLLKLDERAFYVNPHDIVAVTARKR